MGLIGRQLGCHRSNIDAGEVASQRLYVGQVFGLIGAGVLGRRRRIRDTRLNEAEPVDRVDRQIQSLVQGVGGERRVAAPPDFIARMSFSKAVLSADTP